MEANETNDLKILAIDDNPDNLTTLKAVVRVALPGCAVLTALNGPLGLDLAQTEDPDVILLDIAMPGMDGYEVCRKLKADRRLCSIPVVFLTALRTDRESRIEALKAGAEGFLTTPPDEHELVAQIRAMAKVKRANRAQEREMADLTVLVAERTNQLDQQLAKLKQSAGMLRVSEVRYRRLFEAAQDGILILDVETGMIVDVNPFMVELLGYSREQFLDKKVWEVGFLGDVVASQANFAELQEKGYVRYENLALETHDGRRIEVEFVCNIYLEDQHRVAQCNIRDITERKRVQRKVNSQLDELGRWQDAMLDREDRAQELKREVNELCRRLGETARYPSQETPSPDSGTVEATS